MQMRAKMNVVSVEKFQNSEKLNLRPVCSKAFGPEGESEDNTYARYTPDGSCSLTITNPNLIGKYSPGQTFYVDFTEAKD